MFTGLLLAAHAAADGRVTLRSPTRFFTAVSTICVTGLATVDMATHLSPFGQVLVFLGVNIGGMGVLTLASILGLVISQRLGLRAKLIAASDTNPLRTHGGPVNEGQTVVGQLRVGGRLVQPIGPGGAELVTVFERRAGGLVSREVVCHANFVRLYGRHGYV